MIFHKNIIRCRLLAALLAAHLAVFPVFPALAQAQEAETRTLQNLQYEYDALGNITRITDTSETDTAKTARYTYDDLSRLIEAAVSEAANGDNYTRNYTYSPTGNLIQNSAVGDYAYGGRHPQAVTGAGNTNYAYDAQGNLTEDGTWTHTYDYKNRLTNSTNGDANIGYTYANNSERIKKTDGENTTLYVSDGYEIRDDTQTVHVFANGERVATIKGGVITFHHPDHLTGANVATDADGQVTELADYYPYGEDRVSESTNDPADYRFTDQEKDNETGLYYYGARYYNPLIGRFISLDPWQGDLADPQSLNKYSYARNNPLKYIDPSGETSLEFAAGFAYQFVNVMAIGILPPISQQSPADMLQGALTGNIIGGMVGAMEVVAGVVGGTAGTGGGLVLCPVTVGAGCGAAALSAGAGIAIATHGAGAFMTAVTQNMSGGASPESGKRSDRNQFTQAGRAMQKHSNRKGDILESMKPKDQTASGYNKAGQELLEKIVGDKNSSTVSDMEYTDIFSQGGKGPGARFDNAGNFETFVNPKK